MTPKENLTITTGKNVSSVKNRFIQPISVALVSIFFAMLLFGTAMMDLRRLEGILLDMLKKKALYIVEGMEKGTSEKYRHLMQAGQERYRGLYPGFFAQENGYAVEESLAKTLMDLASYIDNQESLNVIPREKLAEFCLREHIRSVALLDDKGRVSFQTGHLPSDIFSQAKLLAEGRQNIAMRLFGPSPDWKTYGIAGFVGVHRQNGKGAVLVLFDETGLEHWGLRVSTQEALGEMAWSSGVVYMAVEDLDGRLITQTGRVPEEKVEECLLLAGQARDPESAVSECVRVGSIKFLEVIVPFHLDGDTVGKVRVGLETQETDELLREKRRHVFFWTALMIGVGFFAMGLLYRSQNRHISKLQAVRDRLYQAEKLTSLARLGAKVAHEVRNPLNGISMAVQRLQHEFAPEGDEQKRAEFDRISRNVRDEIRRINNIVEDFLSLSRSERLELRRGSLVELLEKILFLASEEVRSRDIRIEKDWADGSFLILMDVDKMEQALLNIVRNAADSISGPGAINISLEVSQNGFASIKVRDTGVGVPEGEEERIFDAYYTTKEKGTGLGLAIAQEIIAAHGGEIRVRSRKEMGSTFEVLLPLCGKESATRGRINRE